MKPKYIVGDLVKVSIDDKEQVVQIIGYAPAYESYLLANEYINETRGCVSVVEKKIKQIRLTLRILQKNEWSENRYTDMFYKAIGEGRYLNLRIEGKAWTVGLAHQDLLKNIKYVHELQHLLFGLGLNSEMEV